MTAHCTQHVTHSKVKVEENGRKAIFLNKDRSPYRVSKIDDCLVTAGVRTDFLVSGDGASVLVELKGSDVSHACEQLFESVKHANVRPLLEAKVGFLVVCSKVPRFDTFVIKAKNKARKDFGGGFHVVKNQGEFDISRAAEIDGPF